MSDVAIRLDGLILAACLAFGTSVFLATGLISVLLGFAKRRQRQEIWEDARKPFLFGLLSAVAFGFLILEIDDVGGSAGEPDWIDWLSLAYLPLFIGGWVAILRPKR